MPKDTMYYVGNLEVWRGDRRIPKMEIAQVTEKYIRSLYDSEHVLKTASGKECLVDEIIHPANRV
jgi:hypothetical protein